ncbi:hypothetical protein RIF29_41893 [Crotalaria pallida]|uniref:K-box domain-containing protein n=1 Tax=Crotalaria pallida TaxID=3830 RepID=A0AAN9E866_CROPI
MNCDDDALPKHGLPQFRFEFVDIRSGAAFSQFVKRHFGVSEVEHLSMTELMELERITHSTLSQIRSAKMNLMVESVRNLKKKEQVLVKENELLEEQNAASIVLAYSATFAPPKSQAISGSPNIDRRAEETVEGLRIPIHKPPLAYVRDTSAQKRSL